jgi:uncharacterized protein
LRSGRSTGRIADRMNEQPHFFQVGAERLFAVLHMPAKPPACAVVICHAIAEEKLWSHRVYVTLARELAARGIAALRFDYRGEGESDREFEETTVATRVEDTVAAAAALRERVGAGVPLVLLGHRVGGSIAAAAVQGGCAADGLVVWDPIIDGHEYLLQMLRANLTTQIAVEGKVTRTREMLVQEILEGRPVIVEGYPLTRELFEGLKNLDWVAAWRELPRGALILELPRGEETQPAARLRELMSRDNKVNWAQVSEPPFWRETRQFHQRASNMNSRTLDWLGALA